MTAKKRKKKKSSARYSHKSEVKIKNCNFFNVFILSYVNMYVLLCKCFHFYSPHGTSCNVAEYLTEKKLHLMYLLRQFADIMLAELQCVSKQIVPLFKVQAQKLICVIHLPQQRYEDQDLKLQPLPAPKLVPTPDSLPNELFGDVAMVTEFISSYSGLLMPESEYPIYTGEDLCAVLLCLSLELVLGAEYSVAVRTMTGWCTSC